MWRFPFSPAGDDERVPEGTDSGGRDRRYYKEGLEPAEGQGLYVDLKAVEVVGEDGEVESDGGFEEGGDGF